MTPLGVFDLQISVTFQDAAPDYRYLKTLFETALAQELQTMDPAKARTIRWVGDGPRVTRRVYEGARPGGTVRAVWPLVSDFDAAFLGQSQVSGLLRSVAANLYNLLRSGYDSPLRPDWTVDIAPTVSAYSEQLNGPISFWSSGQASITHTRDRFPQTSVTGSPSEDQNENPIGPNSAALTPRAPGGGPTDWTKLIYAIGIVGGGIVVLYYAWPYLSGIRAATAPRRHAYANPRDPQAAIRRASSFEGAYRAAKRLSKKELVHLLTVGDPNADVRVAREQSHSDLAEFAAERFWEPR